MKTAIVSVIWNEVQDRLLPNGSDAIDILNHFVNKCITYDINLANG